MYFGLTCLFAAFACIDGWICAQSLSIVSDLIAKSGLLLASVTLIISFTILASSDKPLCGLFKISSRMCGLIIVLPIMLLMSHALPQAATILYLAGYSCFGFGQGMIAFSLMTLLLNETEQSSGPRFLAHLLLGALFAFAVYVCLIAGYTIPALLAVLIASVLCATAIALSRIPTIEQAEPEHWDTVIIKTRTSLSLATQAACAIFFLEHFAPTSYTTLAAVFCGALAGVSYPLFSLLRASDSHISPDLAQRLGVTMVIAMTLVANIGLLAGVDWVAIPVSCFIGGMALSVLFSFNFCILVIEAREFPIDPVQHFSKGGAAIWSGCIAAFFMATCMTYVQIGVADVSHASLALSNLFALILALIIFIYKPETNEEFDELSSMLLPLQDDSSSEPASLASRCAEIAEEYGLTRRETEVFELLARGRSAKYIQDALFISFSTVKTHIYHIYQKLGINTKQQLIDMIEQKQ